MGIGLMTVCAEIVCDRGLEIAVRVALHASDLLVLSFQSKVGLGVIERECECRLLPGHRRMTGIASLFERAFMGIDAVAINAIRKRQSRVPGLTVLRRSVTALA